MGPPTRRTPAALPKNQQELPVRATRSQNKPTGTAGGTSTGQPTASQKGRKRAVSRVDEHSENSQPTSKVPRQGLQHAPTNVHVPKGRKPPPSMNDEQEFESEEEEPLPAKRPYRRPLVTDDDEDEDEEEGGQVPALDDEDGDVENPENFDDIDDNDARRALDSEMVAFSSRSKNGALSASSASELDLSAEEDDPDVPASVQTRPNNQRTHARRAEIPQWKSANQVNTGVDNDTLHEVSQQEEMARRDRKIWPRATYIPPTGTQRALSLTVQPVQLQHLIRLAIRLVNQHAMFETAFFPLEGRQSLYFNLTLEAAESDPKLEHYAARFEQDRLFQTDIIGHLKNRLAHYRKDVRQVVNELTVTTHYGIEAGAAGRAKASSLMEKSKFVFPIDSATEVHDKKRPFYNTIITAIIKDAFFAGPKKSLARKHAAMFRSSVPGRPNELEVSKPMVALASTCIYAVLDKVSRDPKQVNSPKTFSADSYEDFYQKQINWLGQIEKNTAAYHRLMWEIYKNASESSSMAIDDSDDSADLDVSGMPT